MVRNICVALPGAQYLQFVGRGGNSRSTDQRSYFFLASPCWFLFQQVYRLRLEYTAVFMSHIHCLEGILVATVYTKSWHLISFVASTIKLCKRARKEDEINSLLREQRMITKNNRVSNNSKKKIDTS